MLGLDQGLIKGQRGLVAWVNFNGKGTVAIRQSYNVSSITDFGVGDYIVNFATPMQDSNFCVTGFAYDAGAAVATFGFEVATTTSVRVLSVNAAGNALIDSSQVHVAIFC